MNVEKLFPRFLEVLPHFDISGQVYKTFEVLYCVGKTDDQNYRWLVKCGCCGSLKIAKKAQLARTKGCLTCNGRKTSNRKCRLARVKNEKAMGDYPDVVLTTLEDTPAVIGLKVLPAKD